MKFPDLPLNQRFQFQGDLYVKIGPLIARRERDGASRLLPRSALVTLVGSADPASVRAASPFPEWLSGALEVYERTVRSTLIEAGPGLAEDLDGRLDRALGAGRAAFLALVQTAIEAGGAPGANRRSLVPEDRA